MKHECSIAACKKPEGPKGARWSRIFRANIVNAKTVVVFSTEQYISIFDDLAAAVFKTILDGGFNIRSFDPSLRKAAQRILRILRENKVLVQTGPRAKRRLSRSFVSISKLKQKLTRGDKTKLKKLIVGPGRIIYQLRAIEREIGPERAISVTSSGLANTDRLPAPIFSAAIETNTPLLMRKFFGETVERHACATFDEGDLQFCRLDALNGAHINPETIISYGDKQYRDPTFPYEKFSGDAEYYWTDLHAANSDEISFAPAQFVYSPFLPAYREPMLWLNTTSGTAAGRNKGDAIVRGALELVERDAAMIVWLCRDGVTKINDWTEVIRPPSKAKDWLGIGSLAIYAMRNAIQYPCVLATARCVEIDEPFIACATAADLTWSAAIRRAVMDAVLTQSWLKEEAFRKVLQPAEVRLKYDHARLYGSGKYASTFAFLNKAHSCSLKKIMSAMPDRQRKGQLGQLIRAFERSGFRLWIKDITTSSARALGYNVVRVIIPGLVPIQFGVGNMPLGLLRLVEILHSSRATDEMPHPFG